MKKAEEANGFPWQKRKNQYEKFRQKTGKFIFREDAVRGRKGDPGGCLNGKFE